MNDMKNLLAKGQIEAHEPNPYTFVDLNIYFVFHLPNN
jgi:hypothetical protein